MLHSFFPRPRLFFLSAFLWALLCVIAWFGVLDEWGPSFNVGSVLGVEYPVELAEDADEAAQSEFAAATKSADNMWFYLFMAFAYLSFVIFWLIYSPHKWSRWSVFGSAVIMFVVWYDVQVSVLINAWYREFFDMIQRALSAPDTITIEEFNSSLLSVFKLLVIAVAVFVLNNFLVSHYLFRWRTAMNDYYTSVWEKVRHIEGASQRVQEDTSKFATIVERLGISMISAVMTLIAFLPVLWDLSQYVKEVPILGSIPYALVWTAILWSVFGTGLLALVGIRLPGLEFKNQRVEAAYRKELVLGEDSEERAEPATLVELYDNVRKNYFKLYFNYLYFNVFRSSYLQVGNFIPFFFLGPSVVAATVTLGLFNQIISAFGKVENSFQYLVNSWGTIVELISIYKRLQAFEATINDKPLPKIDQDYLQEF